MWLFFGTLLVMSVVSCVLRVKTGNIMYMNYYRTIHSNILSLPPLGVWGMKEMTHPHKAYGSCRAKHGVYYMLELPY